MLMGKLKTTLAVLLVLGAVTLTCGVLARSQLNDKETPVAKEQEQPKEAKANEDDLFSVTATPQKVKVRLKEPFDMRLRVVNSSRSAQSFRVMSCSWDEHWKSSNEEVSWVGWACTKNFEVTEKLEPAQAYEKTLPMLLLAGEPHKKVSFRMGFTPIGSKRTYWSNVVILQVEEAQTSERTQKAVEMLKANLDGFGVYVSFVGDIDERYGTISLATIGRPLSKTPPHWLGRADLGKEGAVKLIDHLARSGFFDRATAILMSDQDARLRFYSSRKGPYYSLSVGAAYKAPQYCEILGWDLGMLHRLDALRKALDGDAVKLNRSVKPTMAS